MPKKVYDFSQFIKESLNEEGQTRIFCDMDGVLTDFDRGFKRLKANHPEHLTPDEYEKKHGEHSIWPLIDAREEKFWVRLPWMKDGRELWDYLKRYSPIVLSAPSRSKHSVDGKMKWIKVNLGINQSEPTRSINDMDPDSRIILANDKAQFVKSKNDILIDDRQPNIDKWVAAGGTAIHHDDATDTIRLLEEILSRNSDTEEIQ